jgi:hypothetical protein
MRLLMGVGGMAVLLAGTAAAQDMMEVAGHQVAVIEDGMGTDTLTVDGVALHENGLIFLDPAVQVVGGVTVVTGIAGSGGNACGAPPFVLAFPDVAEPQLFGPLDSCREFQMQVQPEALVFSTEPLPAEPGEVWVWNPVSGLTEASPEEFAAEQGMGWEALDSLAGAHPVDAMKLAPVLAALRGGLGAEYPAFAERISDLGSGDLTAEGYLGEACLKYTCDDDWALLYLHRDSQQVFAAWQAASEGEGEGKARLWPDDPALWPPEATVALRGRMGDEG